MNKWISDCKVEDLVIIDSEVYVIVEAKKKQFVCKRYGGSEVERIMINGGKVVGRYSNTWAHPLTVSIDEYYIAKKAKEDEKKAAADQRAQEWAERIANVKAVNKNIVVTDEAIGGLKKANMVNMRGEPVIVFFTAREESMWKDYSKPPVDGFRISCNTWAGRHGESYGFSGTQASGVTIEEALIELVAGHYWD